MNDSLLYKEESYKIIGACMEVHRILGPGFLEAVYQEALEKAVSDILDEHRAQTINYLKATRLELALLINFGEMSLHAERLDRFKNQTSNLSNGEHCF